MSEAQAEYKIEGRPSTIFRTVKNKDNPYVMIDRRPIDNRDLSFKAKGILVYLMSRPDGWEVSVADLVKRSTDGEAAIRSGLKELRNVGHMRYVVNRDDGRFSKWAIEVYEIPQFIPSGTLSPTLPDSVPSDETIDETAPPYSDNHKVDTPTDGASPFCGFPLVEKPLVDNRTQVVLSTLSNNELKKEEPSSKKTSKKGDLVDGALHYMEMAKDRGEDKIEEILCDLERLLCRKIQRAGTWQDLAKWMLHRQETEPYSTWALWYMNDPFQAKTSWRLTPDQVKACWPKAFEQPMEEHDPNDRRYAPAPPEWKGTPISEEHWSEIRKLLKRENV